MWPTCAWETVLPPSECLTLLANNTEPDTFWRRFRKAPSGSVFSSIRGDAFRLYTYGPPIVRNSFEPYFYGTIVERDGKTFIHGQFRVSPLIVAFTVLFLLAVVVIGMLMAAVVLLDVNADPRPKGDLTPAMVVFAPLGMLAFTALIVLMGWALGLDQREAIERFLEKTLHGRRLPPESAKALRKEPRGG
jgi:hypothetical protein